MIKVPSDALQLLQGIHVLCEGRTGVVHQRPLDEIGGVLSWDEARTEKAYAELEEERFVKDETIGGYQRGISLTRAGRKFYDAL